MLAYRNSSRRVPESSSRSHLISHLNRSHSDGRKLRFESLEDRVLLAADLIANGISVSDTTVDPGQSVTINWTAKNQGDSSTISFGHLLGTSQQGVMWSTNSTISTGDTLLEREFLGPLGSGSTTPEAHTISIPNNAVPGTSYWIGVIADYDGDVSESNESNNDDGAPVKVTINQADLIVNDIEMDGQSLLPDVSAGESVRLDFEVENQGTATTIADVHMRWYWGSSSGSTANYIAEGSLGTINGLSPGETETETDAFWTIPNLAAGTYWLTGVIDWDGRVAESDEGNNSRSESFDVLAPDLDVLSVTLDETSNVWYLGEAIDAQVTVENIGTATANNANVEYYLGTLTNQQLHSIGSGQLGGIFPLNDMSPGETATDWIGSPLPGGGWTIPNNVALGSGYYIWARATTDSNDSDSGNDWGQSAEFSIALEPLIHAIRWENANGTELADDTMLDVGETVYIEVDTQGMRGQAATVYLYEYDGLLPDDFISSIDVPIPVNNDTGRLAWEVEWHADTDADNILTAFGSIRPEYRLRESQSALFPGEQSTYVSVDKFVTPDTVGATVLVHGYDLFGDTFEFGDTDPVGYWGESNLQAMLIRWGGGRVYVYNPANAAFELDNREEFLDYSNPNGQDILIFDWVSASADPEGGQAEAAAEALYVGLLDPDGDGTPDNKYVDLSSPGESEPLQFIAHSRGTPVTSETIQRLATRGVDVGYVSYLDIHDFDESDVPFDGLFHDPAVQVWNNIDYTDNYYQRSNVFAVPSGRSLPHLDQISYAYNYDLTGLPGLGSGLNPFYTTHSGVKDWYFGTVLPGVKDDSEDWYLDDLGWDTGFSHWMDLGGFSNTSTNGINSVVDPVTLIGLEPYNEVVSDTGDDNNAKTTITNNDFNLPDLDSGLFGNDANSLAGWHYFGGEGSGHLAGPDGAAYLELDLGDSYRQHNRLYIPDDAVSVSFDLRVSAASQNDLLRVYLGNTQLGASINVNSVTSDFMNMNVPVAAGLRNTIDTLRFSLEAPGALNVIDSEVHIDNIEFIVISADFDQDGDVDGVDFLTWQRGFGGSPVARADGDANLDGTVDVADLDVWSAAYGTFEPPPLATAIHNDTPSAATYDSALVNVILGLELLSVTNDEPLETQIEDPVPYQWIQSEIHQPSETAGGATLKRDEKVVVESSERDAQIDQPWLTGELLERVFG